MSNLTTTELAAELNLSKGRISQYVSGGKLTGCYQGDGRQRRFDLDKVRAALGRNLDPGQLLGNGSETALALHGAAKVGKSKPAARGGGAEQLPDGDDDRYKMARTLKAEEEARRIRRQNATDEGTYVLASEVALHTKRLLGQEIAEFEGVLRDGARRIADELGVDFKETRALLIAVWRAHRGNRAEHLEESAGSANMAVAEKDEDI